jgi:polyisoprenoid-binding protein YceI
MGGHPHLAGGVLAFTGDQAQAYRNSGPVFSFQKHLFPNGALMASVACGKFRPRNGEGIMSRLFLVLSIAVFSATAGAATQTLSAKGGQVDILALGRPSFVKIHGVGEAPSGKVLVDGKAVSGEFEFALKTLATGIELRDEHMKNKYLEVEKFPKARLVIQKVKTTDGWSVQKPTLKDAAFEGTLTLHGITKPVTGTFSMGDKRDVSAKFDVKLTDFQVIVPSFAGITVKDEVEVNVKIDQLDTI